MRLDNFSYYSKDNFLISSNIVHFLSVFYQQRVAIKVQIYS